MTHSCPSLKREISILPMFKRCIFCGWSKCSWCGQKLGTKTHSQCKASKEMMT